MKKEERLHRLFGDIDDELVADAARKPIRKAVWVPAVAAAACVALTVGLWQGGVFDPAEIPVETPDVSTTTTENVTEPSKDTTTTTEPSKATATTTEKTTEPSKATATTTEPSKTDPSKTTKQPTKTEPAKTTVTTIDGKMVVFADEATNIVSNALVKSHYMDRRLKEKMKIYEGQDVLYAVIVEVPILGEDIKELPSLPKEEWYSDDKTYSDEYLAEFFGSRQGKRVKKLKEIIGEELIPVSTDERYFGFYTGENYAFIMNLTAEQINELGKCDCFVIRLRHPDGDAGVCIPQ